MLAFDRNNNFYLFIISLLIYLPTCAFIPIELYLIFIPILGIHYKVNWAFIKQIKLKKIDRNLLWILGIVALAGINRLIHWDMNNDGMKGLYSYMYLIPLTYFISRMCFKKKVFHFIIYFVLIEIGIAIIEYSLGISTIFKSLGTYREFDSYQMLYYTRVFGLSANSPIFAIKIFMALVLMDYIYLKKWMYVALKLTFFIGIILTFNRSVFLIICLYLFIRWVFDSITIIKNKNKTHLIYFLLNLSFFIFWFHNPNWFSNQFTRNQTQISYNRLADKGLTTNQDHIEIIPDIEMSGRREIWGAFLNFSKDHLIFGNGSNKYMLGDYHAHNSFLEILSSNGIIITLAMLLLIAININRFNYLIILIFLALSMGQYFIFWGVSLGDIVFLSFLFSKKQDFECLLEK